LTIPRAICVEHNTGLLESGSLWIATLRTKQQKFDAARKRIPVKLAAPQIAAAASRPKLSRNVTHVFCLRTPDLPDPLFTAVLSAPDLASTFSTPLSKQSASE
jgi:hypothetical protein